MLLVRHGEIYTKSEFVRKQFIKRLVDNLRLALPGVKIEAKRWRILIHNDSEEAIDALKHAFGVVSFSKAVETKPVLKEIIEAVDEFIPAKGSFAIDTKRIDKNFPLTSQEVNEKIGEHVLEKNPLLKVDLKKPGTKIGVEILKDSAFVFSDFFQGPGGLPLGSAGLRLKCSFENDFDLAAAWMMMKRGVIVVPFNEKLKKWSYGFTEGKAVGKVIGCLSVEDFIEKQKKSDMVLFAPLIGLTEKEVEELLERVLN